jgi:hypothetical protein
VQACERRAALDLSCWQCHLEPQAALLALPARAGILPILLAHRPLNRALHPRGQAQLEHIRLAPPFGLGGERPQFNCIRTTAR